VGASLGVAKSTVGCFNGGVTTRVFYEHNRVAERWKSVHLSYVSHGLKCTRKSGTGGTTNLSAVSATEPVFTHLFHGRTTCPMCCIGLRALYCSVH
jgi:hypothetical protein